MLAFERHQKIMKCIKDLGSVQVTDLAHDLKVTEETIRRDLRKLDDEGKLVRIHGGAIAPESEKKELPFDIRETANPEEKKAIAKQAIKYVGEGDVIVLDASSTACELARVLPDMPMTVITNSKVVIHSLVDYMHPRIVSTGGILDVPSLSYVGTMAEKALERFNINKAFISCKGVDLARGLSVVDDFHARIKRCMVELAETVYLLADHTKFNVKSVEFFAGLEEVDVVVTDRPPETECAEALTQLGIRF